MPNKASKKECQKNEYGIFNWKEYFRPGDMHIYKPAGNVYMFLSFVDKLGSVKLKFLNAENQFIYIPLHPMSDPNCFFEKI